MTLFKVWKISKQLIWRPKSFHTYAIQFPKQFKEKLPCEISTLVQKFIFWDFQSLNKPEEGVEQIFFSGLTNPSQEFGFY